MFAQILQVKMSCFVMSPCLFDNYVLKALRLWGEQRVHELRQEDKE